MITHELVNTFYDLSQKIRNEQWPLEAIENSLLATQMSMDSIEYLFHKSVITLEEAQTILKKYYPTVVQYRCRRHYVCLKPFDMDLIETNDPLLATLNQLYNDKKIQREHIPYI